MSKLQEKQEGIGIYFFVAFILRTHRCISEPTTATYPL